MSTTKEKRTEKTNKMVVACIVVLLTLAGCVSTNGVGTAEVGIELVDDSNHVLELPQEFKQTEYVPHDVGSFYEKQAVLRAELGARFYNRGDVEQAVVFFDQALDYDEYNNKAQFSLGLIHYKRGEFTQALDHFRRVRRAEPLFPYDIDYYKAAQMILSYFPFQAKVTALYQNDRSGLMDETIVINKGAEHGVQVGMEFQIYRVGNAIRDVESMQVIGTQTTPIGTATVKEVEPRNAVAHIKMIDPFQIQIDDLLETRYMSSLGRLSNDEEPVDATEVNL